MLKVGKLLLSRKSSKSMSVSSMTDESGSFTSDEGSSFSDMTLRSEKSSTHLDKLIFDGRWEEAIAVLRANGRHAMTFRKSHQFINTLDSTILLPIHLACANSTVKLDFLELLLFSNPASIHEKELSNGRLCLHIALKCNVPDHIILYLVEKYPGSLMTPDLIGRLPLHYAISNHRSFALISEFISRYPRTILASDNDGWSPLHVAIELCAPINTIDLILSHSIEAITLTTMKGKTPLDLAMNSSNRNRESVIAILSRAEELLCEYVVVANFREAEKKEKNVYNMMTNAVFT